MASSLGDLVYAFSSTVWKRLAGNTTATKKFLRQTGTGAVSAAPAWDTIAAGDLPAGTVTTSATLTAGKTIIGAGTSAIDVSALTATVAKSSSGTLAAAVAATDYVAPGAVTTDGITMSTARLLGRTTAATGAIEEISVGTGLTLSAGSLTASGGSGTVTTTGSPASGNLTAFSGTTSITNTDLTGDVTTSGTVATTIAANAVTTSKITNAAVTLAKIANAAASSKLVGSGLSGSGAAYSELTLGTGLSMSGTTLNAAAAVASAVVLITETVTSSSATTVSFTSIAATYRDLRLVIRGRSQESALTPNVIVQFNGDTAGNYDFEDAYVIGATNNTIQPSQGLAVTKFGGPFITGATASTNVPGEVVYTIFDYRGTTFQKMGHYECSVRWNTTTGTVLRMMGMADWRSTTAITRIDVTLNGGNAFVDNSVVSLYGLF